MFFGMFFGTFFGFQSGVLASGSGDGVSPQGAPGEAKTMPAAGLSRAQYAAIADFRHELKRFLVF
ncbi:MAG: hypothetical protein ACREEX_03600, partial [Caulobacteraceae bacterium]